MKLIKYWDDQRERYTQEVRNLPPAQPEAHENLREISLIALRVGEFLHWLTDSINIKVDRFAEEVKTIIMKDVEENLPG